MKKKNNILIIIAAAALLVIVGALGVVLITGGSGSSYEKEVKLAVKYFESADYDNAIISYEEAIRADAMSEEAYIGIARSYREKKDLRTALNWLDTGFQKTFSPKLMEMINEYQQMIENGESSLEYAVNEVLAGAAATDVYHDILILYSTYNFGSYSQYYTFAPSMGDTKKVIREIPVTLYFNSAPAADSIPEYITVSDMNYIFTGFTTGMSYERLSALGLTGLKFGMNSVLGCNAVEFDDNGCHVAVECDESGNIVKRNPKNRITVQTAAVADTTNPADSQNATESAADAEDSTNAETGKFELKGFIVNEKTDSGLGGAIIEIAKGKVKEHGKIFTEIRPNSNGDYSVMLEAGTYAVTVSCDGYISTTEEIVIKGDNAMEKHDFKLKEEKANAGMIRFELTWTSGADLDSYLDGKTASGSNVSTNFRHRNAEDANGETLAALDIDQLTSGGKETTILYDSSGEYEFFVHKFSGNVNLGETGAVVKIYLGESNTPEYTLEIPQDVDTNAWSVCKISNGKVNIINKGEDRNTSGYNRG